MNNPSLVPRTVDEIALMLQNDQPSLHSPVDGNSFVIMGACTNAIRYHLAVTVPRADIDAFVDQFLKECTKGDYHELLRTCMKYVKFVGFD